MKYTITGANGNLGSQIVREMKNKVTIDKLSLGVHTPAKSERYKNEGFKLHHIEYFEEESMEKAFADTDVLIYISSKSSDSFSRVTELEHVINAAEKSKVGHVIATGFIADRVNNPFALSAFYGYLPRRLAYSSLNYTIIRNALYADPLVPYTPELIQRGNIIYPMENETLSFISLEDSAEAFAEVATNKDLRLNGKIYTLTQNRSYTMNELSDLLSELTGHQIGYDPLTLDKFAEVYKDSGGKMLASMYEGGALGLLDEVSGDFEQITGRKATNLETFLKQYIQTT